MGNGSRYCFAHSISRALKDPLLHKQVQHCYTIMFQGSLLCVYLVFYSLKSEDIEKLFNNIKYFLNATLYISCHFKSQKLKKYYLACRFLYLSKLKYASNAETAQQSNQGHNETQLTQTTKLYTVPNLKILLQLFVAMLHFHWCVLI